MKKIVQRTKGFEKAFAKLLKKQQKKFLEKLEIFLNDECDIRLKTHRLKGRRKDEFSFSITGNIRAIYRKQERDGNEINIFTFIDIGTHNQVY